MMQLYRCQPKKIKFATKAVLFTLNFGFDRQTRKIERRAENRTKQWQYSIIKKFRLLENATFQTYIHIPPHSSWTHKVFGEYHLVLARNTSDVFKGKKKSRKNSSCAKVLRKPRIPTPNSYVWYRNSQKLYRNRNHRMNERKWIFCNDSAEAIKINLVE